MDPAVVEAVPAAALHAQRLAVAREIGRAIVIEDVVLPGHIADSLRPESFEHLIGGVELVGLGQLRDVAGVQHERRMPRHCVELGDRFLKRRRDVLVRLLIEADVAIADLREEDVLFRGVGSCPPAELAQGIRPRYATLEQPKRRGTCPGHAPEEPPAVDVVFPMIVRDVVRAGVLVAESRHWCGPVESCLSGPRRQHGYSFPRMTARPAREVLWAAGIFRGSLKSILEGT